MRLQICLTAILSATVGSAILPAAEWPQFRGHRSLGVAESGSKLPAELGPETNVVWKTELPPGHSSPVVFGDRIYLTAVQGETLLTIGLDRMSGKILWQAEAPHDRLEKIHGIGSYAQPSPATDGERVVSFFGSSGMFCYSPAGKLLWHKPLGPFNNDFGAGSSPIIEGNRIIICQDHDTDSFLAAFDKRSGEMIWKTDRSEFPRNYCTPVIWDAAGRKQIVVAATLRVVGYDFETGRELWTVRGISRTVCMTPVVGDDGVLYVAGWAAGGDAGEPITLEPFAEAVKKYDADNSATLEELELPKGDVKQRFSQFDRDKSGGITAAEYDFFQNLFKSGKNLVVAIKPGGEGDVTDSHVAWQYAKFVPFCASPLVYEGRVFTIKDGGILSCLDARTGKPLKQQRLTATNDYYSSPVAGDGKVYLANEEGKVTVVSAAAPFSVVSTAEFGEDIYATPAIVDGHIYLRTNKKLYCFAER